MFKELSPSYRTVFNLYVIEGYEHKEIAEMLGVSIGTSLSNLHKARKKLQELILINELWMIRCWLFDDRYSLYQSENSFW